MLSDKRRRIREMARQRRRVEQNAMRIRGLYGVIYAPGCGVNGAFEQWCDTASLANLLLPNTRIVVGGEVE